jgi:murein DD-endopeptidase MepM/ murein hydrolase activator NlpD
VVRLIEKTETPYGWVMAIDHGNDISTWYAHLSSFSVKKGDKVEAGQKIGEVGNTGRSTGPHLHFELRIRNTPINPRPALP